MAIAVDTSAYLANGTGSSRTFSYTVTGLNPILIVGINATSSNLISGITYNGSALTKIDETSATSAGNYSMWLLMGPSTGANNIVVSAINGTDAYDGSAASYTGTGQLTQPQSHGTNQRSISGTSIIGTVTTTSVGCWLVIGGGNSVGTPSAGTSTTQRVANSNGHFFGDSNGIVSPGSNSLAINVGSGSQTCCVLSIIPIQLVDGSDTSTSSDSVVFGFTSSLSDSSITSDNVSLKIGFSSQSKSSSTWTSQNKS